MEAKNNQQDMTCVGANRRCKRKSTFGYHAHHHLSREISFACAIYVEGKCQENIILSRRERGVRASCLLVDSTVKCERTLTKRSCAKQSSNYRLRVQNMHSWLAKAAMTSRLYASAFCHLFAVGCRGEGRAALERCSSTLTHSKSGRISKQYQKLTARSERGQRQ